MDNAQSATPSLMRSNSGLLWPHTHCDNVNLRGSMPNAPSILNQSLGNSPCGDMCMGLELDSLHGAGSGMGFNPQYSVSSDQHPSNLQHPHQPMQQFAAALSHQPQQHQFQSIRGALGEQPVVLDQQQQQFLQMPNQSSLDVAAGQLNVMQHQKLLRIQQQQQLRLSRAVPKLMRPAFKQVYRVGMCARRVTEYMFQQKNRPQDNSIEFWRKFVSEFFAPNAKKKWCVSLYERGQQTAGGFARDGWHCEMCNRKPGWSFEATFEILPSLLKIKYESGILEELLYIDMPREYHHPSGHIILIYGKAVQHSVFENLRVVRDGQLRIVFSPDLKILSWEFCARGHEEVMTRRLLIPQVSQLGDAAQKYHASTQNAPSDLSDSDLESKWTMLVASAREVAKALEAPLLNEFGFTKRYVQRLQIAEVINSMKDLIDHSLITGTGPIESLAKRPRRTNTPPGFQCRTQHYEEEQQQQLCTTLHNSDNEQSSFVQAAMSSMMDKGRASLARDRGMGQHQQQDA